MGNVCSVCKAESPVAANFCMNCGMSFNPTLQAGREAALRKALSLKRGQLAILADKARKASVHMEG